MVGSGLSMVGLVGMLKLVGLARLMGLVGLWLKAMFMSIADASMTLDGILNDGLFPVGNRYTLTSAPSSQSSGTFSSVSNLQGM